MHNGSLQKDNRASYTSALHSQRPITRRRRSESGGDSTNSKSGASTRHSRSRTDSTSGRNNGGYPHPLTLNQNGFPDIPGVTRPHLTRVIKKIDDDLGENNGDFEDDAINHNEEEREVIVHEVMPTDSLAGVSVKYGISLADLRKANHLWANDPIHLRKVLYIPLDTSARARELAQEIRLSSAPLIDFSTSSSTQSSDMSCDSNEPPRLSDPSATVGLGIQRVPASRLSFFPPPSTSGKMPSISLSVLPNLANVDPPPAQARHTIAPSLTSILTALPIAASTRDGILARLSFDSGSSSFSDRTRPSFERDEGHEMNIVSNHAARTLEPSDRQGHRDNEVADPDSMFALYTPKARHHNYSISTDAVATSSKLPSRSGHRHHISTSPPAAYIPQIPDRTTIRTVQLEPSPMMQLPTLRPRKSQQPTNGNTGWAITHQDNVFELQAPNSRDTG